MYVYGDIITGAEGVHVLTGAVFNPAHPDQAWYVRAASAGPTWAAVANTGAQFSVVNQAGQRWDSGYPVHGENPVGMHARPEGGWRVVWMLPPDGKHCAEVVLTDQLHPSAIRGLPGRAVGTSGGFLNFDANGNPIFLDDFRTWVFTPQIILVLPVIVGAWVIGQDNFAYRLLAVNRATGQARVVAHASTVTASFGTIDHDGALVVVIAGSLQVVHEAAFTPWTPPQPTPVPPDPTPVPPDPTPIPPKPIPPDPTPMPPTPIPAPFPVEILCMSNVAASLAKGTLRPTTELPDDQFDNPGAHKKPGICYVRNQAGTGYLSLNPEKDMLEDHNQPRINAWEAFHWKDGDRTAVIDAGQPHLVREILVTDKV